MTEFPDLVQYVIGFRAWAVDEEGELNSMGYGSTQWQPGVNTAVCKVTEMTRASLPLHCSEPPDPDHSAPDVRCSCGLYALREPEQAGQLRKGAVLGAVQAWGELAVHRRGFRAQYARIVVLGIPDFCVVDTEYRAAIELAAATYGCEAVPVLQLEEKAREHGIRVPEELLPPKPDLDEEWRHSMLLSGATQGMGMSMPSAGHALAGRMAQGGPLLPSVPPPRPPMPDVEDKLGAMTIACLAAFLFGAMAVFISLIGGAAYVH